MDAFLHNNEIRERLRGFQLPANGATAVGVLAWPDDAEWVLVVASEQKGGAGTFKVSLEEVKPE